MTPTAENFAAGPALDETIDALLGRAPDVSVPAGFATRVATALPRSRRRGARFSSARIVGGVIASVLLAALFLLAPHAAPQIRSVPFDLEMLLCAAFLAMVCWLATPLQSD